jgi:hypothetical protein
MEVHSLLYTVPLHPEMIKMGSFSKVEQQSITKALEEVKKLLLLGHQLVQLQQH